MDRRLSKEEFTYALPALEKWGIVMTEAEVDDEFQLMDDNGGGYVLFEE